MLAMSWQPPNVRTSEVEQDEGAGIGAGSRPDEVYQVSILGQTAVLNKRMRWKSEAML